VRVRGTRLHVEQTGAGEPMLFITGFAISAAVYEPVLPLYAARLRCVTFDNRGAGRSAPSLLPVSIPRLAADAVGVLDGLDIDSAHVYGLSMGGMVAQEMALRFPDRVRGLVLAGTTAGGPRATLPLRELRALGPQLWGPPTLARDRVLAALLFSPGFRAGQPDRVRELLPYLGRHGGGARGARSAAAHWWGTVYHDTWSRLPGLAAPTLVLHGGADGMAPLAAGRELARRIPDAELAVLDGCGHAALLERPEEAAGLVLDWLARRSPIAAGPRLAGLAARTEPVTRALGLTTGALRTGRSAAAVAASAARGRPLSGRRPPRP